MYYRILSLFAGALLLASGVAGAGAADSAQPYPEFVATYDASANGIGIGSVTISLTREGEDRYLYKQESSGSGILSLFRSDDALESSRWQLVDGHIQPLEYRSRRKGGDDDDNAHLLFDWQNHKVKNVGAGEHWEIALPDGALDRLVMQLAMLFDLRDGVTKFDYKVPHQGRIKDYRFAVLGEEDIELTSGVYRTLKVARTNDDKDESWVWSAPELDYFPVRFLKAKESGIRIKLELRKLDFVPFGDATSLEVAP